MPVLGSTKIGNFSNTCNYLNDFGLSCECHFTATSYWKTTCDGIGGTIKSATAKDSFQRTSMEMYDFCKQIIKNLFFPDINHEIKETVKTLKSRYDKVLKFLVHKFQKFVPVSEGKITT